MQPCLACNSDNLRIMRYLYGNAHRVQCRDCRYTGDICAGYDRRDAKKNAVDTWNRDALDYQKWKNENRSRGAAG
jgi:hypothetical protein